MMRPLSILHLIESYWPKIGGGELLLAHLVQEQVAQGHSVRVLTNVLPNTTTSERVQGVRVERRHFSKALEQRDMGRVLALIKEVVALMEAEPPDIIHLHSQQALAFFFLRLPRRTYGQAIYTAHDGNFPSPSDGSTMVRQVVNQVAAVSAPSRYSCRILDACFPEAPAPSVCIYNSLPGPPRPPAGQPAAPPRLLAFGRLVPDKGFDVYIEAAHRVLQQGLQVQFNITGDGPERAALEQLIQHYGLQDRVRLTGWVAPNDVFHAIAEATLVVVPSRWQEPFGLVALQAMQCGRPVVASAVGGLPEVVADQETGLLVPPEDAPALAKALLALLQAPERMAAMGAAGRLRALQHFSWADCARGYDELYQNLLV